MTMPRRTFYLSLLTALGAACRPISRTHPEQIFSMTQAELERARLSYYSDYFSFVGRDERGWVAFAPDNNRGQDGDQFQAEHFVVLHDDKRGWAEVKGSGMHPNPKHELARIPDTEFFRFAGTPQAGIAIASDANGLRLEVAPIAAIVSHRAGLAVYWLGTAAATLHWAGRTVAGRIIYEYLFLPGYNRMTRTYTDSLGGFHGIYAAVEGSGDFYIHQQKARGLEPLIHSREAFLVIGGASVTVENPQMRVTSTAFAAGFFRWPEAWEGTFDADGARWDFSVRLRDRKRITTWMIGGFAMGVVEGMLGSGTRRFALHGLGELIL